MDKSAIRNFATTARRLLNDQVKDKAALYGITEKEIKPIGLIGDGFRIRGNVYDATTLSQYRHLVKEIESKGFNNVIEEVAYTWFNRFIALRFMEVNGYLPFNIHTKVLANVDGRNEPEVIDASKDLGLVSQEVYYSHFDKGDIEGLYNIILINLCNKLSKIMPHMFEKISDYTELLLPDQLYSEGGIINLLVTNIDEEDFKEEVEIIGWLYQYYISERKDELITAKKRYKKEDLPFVTQLFTPNWIVRYMVQNSLGRLWQESHPDSILKRDWDYYLEPVEQEEDVKKQLEEFITPNLNPEDIKVLDPACGSGHILVYAFDILYDIYLSYGYAERDIPKLILEKNLFGLDIDERASQLAYFALLMKARKKNRRLFRSDDVPKVSIYAFKDSNNINKEHLLSLGATFTDKKEWKKQYDDLCYIIDQFSKAKECGSIIKFDREFDLNKLYSFVEDTSSIPRISINAMNINQASQNLCLLLDIVRIMVQKYDVVVTNPPYINSKYLSPELKDYMNGNYEDVKADIFSAFMEKCYTFAKPTGHLGFMTPFVWMFISSFEKLREKMIDTKTISSLIQLEYSGFTEATVPICTFALKNYHTSEKGEFVRLSDFRGADNQPIKAREAAENRNCGFRYSRNAENFKQISGSPIAYWVSAKVRDVFEKAEPLSNIAEPRQGLATADNNRFLRLWFEISNNKFFLAAQNSREAKYSAKKWFPYNKGGEYRKWYGNNEYLVNWYNDGYEIKNIKDGVGRLRSRPQNTDYYFRKSITWSFVSSSYFGVRYSDEGFIFDVGGSSVFPPEEHHLFLTGFLCTKLSTILMKVLNPTLNFQVGNVASLPVILPPDNIRNTIDSLVAQNISLSRADWDSFETSWDFKVHPLVRYKDSRIGEAFEEWTKVAEERFNQLRANEEELNRIFIEIYGLEDELTPEVAEEDVTVSRAELDRDIKSFISYAVGCMFGRYSLDREGLVYAGGEFDKDAYRSFIPCEDNIIPITDQDFFENDIVSKFIEFVEKVYGAEYLEENLGFIASALKPKSTKTSRQVIREYFFNDFFKDHCRTYKKRPIYWQFDTGKAGAMKALVYLHRMDEYTPARVRTDYLHPLMRAYDSEIKRIDQMSDDTLTAAEKASYRKQREDLQKKTAEIMKYDPVIAHIANRRIKLELDDGVKVNYKKYQNVEVLEDGRTSVTASLLTRV